MRALLAVLVLAVAVRLAFHHDVAQAPDTFAPMVDSEAYLLSALRVPAGKPIVDGITFQAPLYPWLLGAALAVSGVPGVALAERVDQVPPATVASALAVGRALNFAFGLGLVALLFWLARDLFGKGAAVWAALLAALYAPALFFEGHLLKENLALLFLPAAVLSAMRGRWFLCGLALGLGTQVRGNMNLIVMLAVLALLLADWRTSWRRIGPLLLAVGLTMAPVIARNSLQAGRLVLSTAAGGTAFYMTNHAGNTTGLVEHVALNRQIPRYELDDWIAETRRRTGATMNPAQLSTYWFAETCRQIVAQPGRWLLAETRKLGLLFSRYEAPDMTHLPLGWQVSPVLAWNPIVYGLVMPLALGGLLLALRRGLRILPLVLAIAGYGGSLLLFVVSSRYRLPLAPLLIVPAGFLLSQLLKMDGGERRAAGVAVLAGLAVSFVSEGPLGPLSDAEKASHMAAALKNRAQVALERGDTGAARADLLEALSVARSAGKDAPALHVALAQAELAEGRQAQAMAELEAALALNRDDPEANRVLGLIHYGHDRYEDAAVCLQRALQALPGDRSALQYLALCRLALGQPAAAIALADELIAQRPADDDGHGIRALALLAAGRSEEAGQSWREYDRLAAEREAAGMGRHLPDQPEFAVLARQEN